MKKCPYCAEEIQDDAVKCKHCGSLLNRPSFPATGTPTPGSVTGEDTICPEFGIDFFLAGRYQIKKEIGRGGMGVVYLAYDDVLEIDVAVKVLPAVFAMSSRAVEALKGEARTAMKLRHPGIVGLHNFVESPDANFLVMEYVEGKSLDEILHDKGKLPLEETLGIARQVAEALDYAHSQGVLHRDIKLGNILVGNGQRAAGNGQQATGNRRQARGSDAARPSREGSGFTAREEERSDGKGLTPGPASDIRAKLTDFGIACEMKNTMTRLTGRQTSGTLLYMSPEQLMGDKLDARADIYSFAATLYECLAGRPPFHTGDIPTQIMQKRPADIEGVPAHVNNALQRGLSKDKKDRPATSMELVKCALTAGHMLGKSDKEMGIQSSQASFEIHMDPQDMLHAARTGDLEKVKALLEIRPSLCDVRDEETFTPLHLATSESDVDMMEILIAKGANVNARVGEGDRRSPLHLVAQCGSKDAATLLIANGAEINAKMEGNITPLLIAIANSNKEIALLLIAKGADVNADLAAGAGLTPLALAKDMGFRNIVSLLRKHGATE